MRWLKNLLKDKDVVLELWVEPGVRRGVRCLATKGAEGETRGCVGMGNTIKKAVEEALERLL